MHDHNQITHWDFNLALSNTKRGSTARAALRPFPSSQTIPWIESDAHLSVCLSSVVIPLSQVQVQPTRQQLRVRQGEAGLRVRAQHHRGGLQPLQEALPRQSLERGLLPAHTQRNSKYMWVKHALTPCFYELNVLFLLSAGETVKFTV